MASSRDQQASLVRRYFGQLTEGCGRRGCPNRLCFSCVDGPGALDRTAAALRSLELAQGAVHFLCDEQPPFLGLELVRELVSEAARKGEWRPLEKEVSGVFSNANALNHSFMQSDTQRQTTATDLQVRMPSARLTAKPHALSRSPFARTGGCGRHVGPRHGGCNGHLL